MTTAHAAIENINHPAARTVLHALAGLVRGDEVPAYGSEEYETLTTAMTAAARGADNEHLRQMGVAALTILMERMQAVLMAERAVLEQQVRLARDGGGK